MSRAGWSSASAHWPRIRATQLCVSNDVQLVSAPQRWRLLKAFVFGLIVGCASLFAAL